jgi:two-component system sensor histidine kinase KdpD
LVRADEKQHGRGHLKIFLGYAAGVGKTYSMLEAAHERLAQGVDVVVAYVETHGRAETERLLQGLEVLPRRTVEYRGTTLGDLDLDLALTRAPKLALVDEFAHTNAPGSRHPKRYQDVQEMLHAGIDVYTTLNIQHVESYNDVVAQITGVRVRETVPDSAIGEPSEVELIDLPPEELRMRLAEGKVYVPGQAAEAVQRFFRPGNLTALREIALRWAAQQVDAQMLAYMQTRSIPGPWPAGERLLVAVSGSPFSERLVRTTKRLADELKADWMALYIETPREAGHPELREQAIGNLALAERLGAHVHTLPGSSIAETLVDYARRHNATKIIAGKPLRPRWRELLGGSVVDRVIKMSGAIDVYVISSGPLSDAPRIQLARPARSWQAYLYSLPPVVLATLIGWPLAHRIEPTNLVMPYLAAVVVAAVYLGRGPAILSAFLSVAAFDFFFVPPHLTLAVSDTQYLLTFAGLFVVGLVVSSLAARVREQARAARRRELQTSELYELSRELAGAAGPGSIAEVVRSHIQQVLGGRAVVLLGEGRELKPAPGFDDVEEDEFAVAMWAFDHGQVAGKGTDTLPGAALMYLPLRTSREIIGVLGVGLPEVDAPMSAAERRVPEAFATLAALAFERADLATAANQLELLRAREALQSALLNSISHELRTPLASIAGVLSTLRATHERAAGPSLSEAARSELVETAWEEAAELNRIVGNLLDMTRLESGALRTTLEPVDVEDLVGSALTQLDDRLGDRDVRIDLPVDLPPVAADSVLMVHVLANVFDNALTYSPPGSPLDISARRDGPEVRLSIADRGIGIPTGDLEAVFDKFYRVQRTEVPDGIDVTRGIGLGLSISRGIVQALGGRIWAGSRAGGGTTITIALRAVETSEPVTAVTPGDRRTP